MLLFLFSIVLFFPTNSDLFEIPAGTVQVADNFYVDAVEVSNRHYMEYIAWLQRECGDTSMELRQAIPDVTVLEFVSKKLGITPLEYLMEYDYSLYPVLGTTLSQATAFCKWRSERVHELLFSFKDIDVNSKQHSSLMVSLGESGFTSKVKARIIRYPQYRIPTSEEWSQFASHPNVIMKFVRRLLPQPYDVQRKIINLFGSVSEMTTTTGLSKGGSYKDDKNELSQDWDRPYTRPSDWVGFRCVCSWEK